MNKPQSSPLKFAAHDFLYREPRSKLLHNLDRLRALVARRFVSFLPVLSDPGRSWLVSTLFPSRPFIVIFEPKNATPASTQAAPLPGSPTTGSQSTYATLVSNLIEAGYLDGTGTTGPVTAAAAVNSPPPPHTVIMAAAAAVSALIQRTADYQQLLSLREETAALSIFLRDNYAAEIARRDHDGLTLSQVVIRYLARERQSRQS